MSKCTIGNVVETIRWNGIIGPKFPTALEIRNCGFGGWMYKLEQGARALGLELSRDKLRRFRIYLEKLQESNRKANLTTITGAEDIQLKHFVDSLTVASMLPSSEEQGLRVLDVGSGAGFPGVPLKIVRENISLFLLESIGKKTSFLEQLARDLELEDVTVLNGRAESLARRRDLRESFDFVVARAVAPLSTLLEFTLPFCRLGGRVVAQKIDTYIREPGDFRKALSELGGEFLRDSLVEVEGLGSDRRLLLFEKIALTPETYPRRPGLPLKRPL